MAAACPCTLTYLKESGNFEVSNYLYSMKMIVNNTLPSHAECSNSLKNVVDALYVLNGKWKLPLILYLMRSPKRFKEIQADVAGISPKVLSNELKELELNGFITRTVYSTTPVSIIYEATDYAHSLKNVLGELSTWGEQHREKIKESMRRGA